jgi:hypothetical protein
MNTHEVAEFFGGKTKLALALGKRPPDATFWYVSTKSQATLSGSVGIQEGIHLKVPGTATHHTE